MKAPDHGFVGGGKITVPAEPAKAFGVKADNGDEVAILDVVKDSHYMRDAQDNLERCEWFVPVKWLQTVALEQGVREIGLFGNQNTVCRPTTPKWRSTVERLKQKFPNFDG